MANPLDDLRTANSNYHTAVDAIFTIVAPGIPIDELVNVKAKFGSFHNNIFQLMTQAQEILVPYFGGGD